jgi:hypothetical protein
MSANQNDDERLVLFMAVVIALALLGVGLMWMARIDSPTH